MRRKEEEGGMQFEEGIKIMSEIGNISPHIIKSYDSNTGGAQNVLKNIDSLYWEDVERICIEIRRKFYYPIQNSINSRYFKSETHGWQSWTCDMWALNFSLWNRGIKTAITDKLDFSWATNDWNTYLMKPIYHNAGALKDSGLFYKGNWIHKSPIGVEIPDSPPNSASAAYIQAIRDVTE